MMFSLEGKTALVTGASGGIGSSIAYALAKQGARLALSGSNADKLRAFREQLNDEFGHDHVEITCDLSNPTQVEELSPGHRRHAGPQWTSSSTTPASRATISPMRMKDEEWDQVIRINLEASFRLMSGPQRAADDESQGRADHFDHQRRRPYRQSRPDELHSGEGGPYRDVEEPRAGTGQSQHHRELRRRPASSAPR